MSSKVPKYSNEGNLVKISSFGDIIGCKRKEKEVDLVSEALLFKCASPSKIYLQGQTLESDTVDDSCKQTEEQQNSLSLCYLMT